METPRVRLGELLVRAGLITALQLEEALAEQPRAGKRLGSLLVESGLVSETQVTQILSQQLSVPWVSLHHIDFSRELLNLVPLDLVERYCLIPIYVRRVRGLGDALYIAMDDPTNAQALTEVAERSRLHVRAMIAPPSDIRAAIRVYYGVGPEPTASSQGAAPALAAAAAFSARASDDDADLPTGIHSRVDRPAPSEVAGAPAAKAAAPPVVAKETAPPVVAKETAPPVVASSLGAPPPKPRAAAPPAPDAAARAAEPPSSTREFGAGNRAIGERARTAAGAAGRGSAKMIALTLLDGTTIRLPAKGKVEKAPRAPDAAPEGGAEAASAPPAVSGALPSSPGEDQLTARDLVAALRAASHGADASDILGENVRWEAMVAALISVLLKKHLIADWEFVEEFKKG